MRFIVIDGGDTFCVLFTEDCEVVSACEFTSEAEMEAFLDSESARLGQLLQSGVLEVVPDALWRPMVERADMPLLGDVLRKERSATR